MAAEPARRHGDRAASEGRSAAEGADELEDIPVLLQGIGAEPRHPDFSGEYLFTELRKRNIVVRHWNKPLISEHLRITIGTDEQMDAVADALKEITAGSKE